VSLTVSSKSLSSTFLTANHIQANNLTPPAYGIEHYLSTTLFFIVVFINRTAKGIIVLSSFISPLLPPSILLDEGGIIAIAVTTCPKIILHGFLFCRMLPALRMMVVAFVTLDYLLPVLGLVVSSQRTDGLSQPELHVPLA
jgi:hypothetical protein